MSGKTVLSLMTSLFQGGSPIIHSNVVAAMHARGKQRHDVLSFTDHVQREHTMQRIEDSLPHAIFTEAQVGLHWLNRSPSDPLSNMDRLFAEQLVLGSDIIFSLKEQPLRFLKQLDHFDKPLVVALHRSDPEHQGSGTQALAGFSEQGLLKAGVCCAYSVRDAYHEATGIPLDLLPVIPNGVNTARFVPSQPQRDRVRDGLRIPVDAPVVFISARFDAMKNIPLFVQTAARFLKEHPDAYFVMCGAGMSNDNGDLQNILDRHVPEAMHARFIRLGIQSNMEALYPAGDLIVLTSAFGEACPLSLMEAMACGLVPVSTDVGDCQRIVGDERLIGPQEPDGLAEHWLLAYAHRTELRETILRNRDDLDARHCYNSYAQLLESL